jgi:cell division initiation protein
MSFRKEEIKNRIFPVVLRGYNREAVSAFLAQLADAFSGLESEKSALEAELRDTVERLRQAEAIDSRLSGVLETVQTSAETFRRQAESNMTTQAYLGEMERKTLLQNAQAEAELIIQDAQKKAEHIVNETENAIVILKHDIALLQNSRHALVSRIKGVLNAQIEFLETLEAGVQDPLPAHESILKMERTRDGVGARELSNILQRLNDLGEDS